MNSNKIPPFQVANLEEYAAFSFQVFSDLKGRNQKNCLTLSTFQVLANLKGDSRQKHAAFTS